jgi:hypothetical protein
MFFMMVDKPTPRKLGKKPEGDKEGNKKSSDSGQDDKPTPMKDKEITCF